MQKNSNLDNEENSVEILTKRKEHLQQRLNFFSFRLWVLVIFFLFGAANGLIFYKYTHWISYDNRFLFYIDALPMVFLGAMIGIFVYGYIITFFRLSLSNTLRRIDYKIIQIGSTNLLKDTDGSFFTKLVDINFKYIDKYYLQTQEQADKSFELAKSACNVGLLIVAVGIILMFFNRMQPAYLTTAAGVMTELIASVFFYFYNKTIQKMSIYHQKLILTQNIGLALKISEDMEPESKKNAQVMLIERLTLDINKYLASYD